MMSVSVDNNNIYILEQTFFPKTYHTFHSSNGVVVCSSVHPAAYFSHSEIRLYVRGSDPTKNNWPIILRSTKEVIKCVEALKEFCKYHNNDFKIVNGRIKMK